MKRLLALTAIALGESTVPLEGHAWVSPAS